MDAESHDRLDRPLRDLRVSVTDRCNFRCTYCMPREVFGRDFEFLPPDDLLSFEEITRAVGALLPLGIEKVRITGGEPLVRRDLPTLVAMLAGLPGLLDLTLTTNGSLLAKKAADLAEAGLRRVTVSLDSLDDDAFKELNDASFPVSRVLAGIDAAREAGLSPIKVNMVVKRGVNEDSVLPMARHFRGTGVVLRFIEYMDVGSTNGWRMEDVVPAAEILDTVAEEMPLTLVPPARPGEVARRFRYADGGGEIGIIASVTRPFCSTCTRLRLSSEGRLYTCLFATRGHDLREVLRSGATDEEVAAFVARIWSERKDRYSELRTAATDDGPPRVEMSHIGG